MMLEDYSSLNDSMTPPAWLQQIQGRCQAAEPCAPANSFCLRGCVYRNCCSIWRYSVWGFWGWRGSVSWCSLFLLETSVFRVPEGMPQPALKDRSMAIFWRSVPYLCVFRLWMPEVYHWDCTSGLIRGQIPHLRTGQLGRYERDWILYLHPLHMPLLLCRIDLICIQSDMCLMSQFFYINAYN